MSKEPQQEADPLHDEDKANEGAVVLTVDGSTAPNDLEAVSKEERDDLKECASNCHKKTPPENPTVSDYDRIVNSSVMTTKEENSHPKSHDMDTEHSINPIQLENIKKQGSEVQRNTKESPTNNISGVVIKENDYGKFNARNGSNDLKATLTEDRKEKESTPRIARDNISSETDNSLSSKISDKAAETPNNSAVTDKGELHVMFSDDEDGENECSTLDEDVSQRITRIQSLLKNDRLRTNRKRKHPII